MPANTNIKRVNLLQPELIPPKQQLTLNRMLISWVLVFAVFFGLMTIVESLHISEKNKSSELKAKQRQKQQHLDKLNAQLRKLKVDEQLQARLDATKALLSAKRSLYRKLSATKGELITGFSPLMSELSIHHHKFISLKNIYVTDNEIAITGLAQKPEHIPQWLTGFEQSKFMNNKQFSGLVIKADELGVAFSVSSKTDESIKDYDASKQDDTEGANHVSS